MVNVIVVLIIIVLVVAAIYYIIKSKKQGNTCIGCPSCGACNKRNCSKDL